MMITKPSLTERPLSKGVRERMNPFFDPRMGQENLIHQKLQKERGQMPMEAVKLSIRVLRKEFGFSPEMIHEFVGAFQDELKSRRSEEYGK